ncbi:two-component system response regulator [Shewanella sp. D64]|uniref:HD-GYP domain-containing protein n=1 Tax=unclassified Shewanella TaxID=196818 RepID=UPI0022BA5CC8|nr:MULTISPECIES: two-component system response regulator [unclassified Shewanella]MEC4724679.1 two-component system response regulator [Shewanella sp. D64]MEC4736527.1 two-component system response regulator [Shewanella sp. E94]WBJ97420.1 two-component system response regulator [Shewanella sp. MTB7]
MTLISSEFSTEISKQTVLIVDDTPDNLTLLHELLKDVYHVKAAVNGAIALNIISKGGIDIILLDVMMPVMDGYEVCRRVKGDAGLSDIPIIFLTAKTSINDETMGFDLGAADYLSKPISPPLLLARVKTHLQIKASKDFLKNQNAFLEIEVERRTQEVVNIQNVTITAMANLAETRDPDTGFHIKRTQIYMKLLATQLGTKEKYSEIMTSTYIERLFTSAPLHDIGKVGITDNILLKPGKLTREEFEVMKTHAYLGFKSLETAEKHMEQSDTFLHIAKDIAHHHHEKWDGSGYPDGLVGEDIPLSARMMAIADVYDALISKRVYKDAMTHETALDIIKEGRGNHFDPELIDAFLEVEADFFNIASKYKDDD